MPAVRGWPVGGVLVLGVVGIEGLKRVRRVKKKVRPIDVFPVIRVLPAEGVLLGGGGVWVLREGGLGALLFG